MRTWSLVLLSMLCASAAVAEPPVPVPSKTRQAAAALVNKHVVQVLKNADAKRSRFSRSAPPPKARRVRVVDTVVQADVQGRQFVRFAIDVRTRWADDGEWALDAFLGCVYVDQKQVFLQQGSDYLPASGLLSGEGEPQPDVCRPALTADAAPRQPATQGAQDEG